MGMYVTITLSVSTFNEVVERLQDSASSLNDYYEMEDLVNLIHALQEEYDESMAKQDKEWHYWKKHQEMFHKKENEGLDIIHYKDVEKILNEYYDEDIFEESKFHCIMEILELFKGE